MADFRFWPATNGPASAVADDPVNLGHIFQVTQTCWAKAILFYRGTTAITGTPKGRIFLVSGGTVVSGAAVDFPALSGTGWQTATLATPVQLTANTSYKVAVNFPAGYTASGNFWNVGAGVGGISNGPLVAPDAGGAPLGIGSIQQGSYHYSSDPDVYPDTYFQGGNYWVDVLVTDTDPAAAQTITMGFPVEEDAALPLALGKVLTVGLPSESSTAFTVAFGKTVLAGVPAEESVALPVVSAKSVALGLPAETATALETALGKSMQLGLPAEVDSALAVVLSETVLLGLPLGQDLPLGLLVNDVWPPSTQPPSIVRWASTSPPTVIRWATTGPPTTT